MKKQLLIITSLAGILTMGSVQAITFEELQAMDRSDRRDYIQSLTNDERTAQRESFQAEGHSRPENSGRGGSRYNSNYQSNYESGQTRPSYNSNYQSNYESGQTRSSNGRGNGGGRPW
jgi:hypothetical protein